MLEKLRTLNGDGLMTHNNNLTELRRLNTSIVIVEPHADDAFLSTHGHIVKWMRKGHSIHIVTLHMSDNPVRLVEAKAYADKVVAAWTGHDVGDGKPTVALPTGQLILPLGIRHPDHVLARQTLETPAAWFYLDMPYAIVQRDGDLVNDLLRGMEIVSLLKPHANKWRNLKIFKSQSSYFSMRGRDEQRKASFELIVKR